MKNFLLFHTFHIKSNVFSNSLALLLEGMSKSFPPFFIYKIKTKRDFLSHEMLRRRINFPPFPSFPTSRTAQKFIILSFIPNQDKVEWFSTAILSNDGGWREK
jgi:hypothetical protein